MTEEHIDETTTLLALSNDKSGHNIAPAYLRKDMRSYKLREVYYISDLHLVHHILSRFPKGATDKKIREYIHEIVIGLFDGEFGTKVYNFKSPVVMFGGDIASSFAVSDLFYRDFIKTWKRRVKERYDLCCKQLDPITKELIPIRKEFNEWKYSNSWADKLKISLDKSKDKRITQRIREIYCRIQILEKQEEDIKEGLDLGYDWKSDYEKAKKHEYVYAILGNHELWDFDSYDSCVHKYQELFDEIDIKFLCDQGCFLGKYTLPWRFEENSNGRKEMALINKKDNSKEYERQLIYYDNLIIVGGIGFSGKNSRFNANQGIYGLAVDRKEEIQRCAKWVELFRKGQEIARENHCALVVFTHTPFSDWGEGITDYENCFFFSGHTHRNLAYGEEKNNYFISDNQVGYYGKSFKFKKAALYMARNPFASDPDGYREISCIEYKEYYRFALESIPGTGTIERQISQNKARLYVMKQGEYVGFFLVSLRGVYICNGGQIRRIGSFEPLDRYYKNFYTMIEKYIVALTPLRQAQEKLSAYIKSFGGEGRIHGTIVDIDFENHVMINTDDGTITPYNSPVFGIVKKYQDIGSLIHECCPELEAGYSDHKEELVLVSPKESGAGDNYEMIDIKNSPYAVSRRVNALQRLFEKKILRDWNPQMEEY